MYSRKTQLEVPSDRCSIRLIIHHHLNCFRRVLHENEDRDPNLKLKMNKNENKAAACDYFPNNSPMFFVFSP